MLPDWERRVPGSARAALLNLPGMTESIADAILDWLDADGAQRQFGAEADYYAGLQLPYAPRNATPGCLEELAVGQGRHPGDVVRRGRELQLPDASRASRGEPRMPASPTARPGRRS